MPWVGHAGYPLGSLANPSEARTAGRRLAVPLRRVPYAASRSDTSRLFTEATLIALATPTAFSTLILSQLGSNSYQASPWRAEVGCAWGLLCQPSPKLMMAIH